MKKEYILLLLSVFVLIRGVDAQVQVDSKLNRAEIVIGEQAVLTTTVSANANQSNFRNINHLIQLSKDLRYLSVAL